MVKVYLTYFKKGKPISSRDIESSVNEYAFEKAINTKFKEGLTVSSDGLISWYCYPDKVKIFVPEINKAFYYKIIYSPHYADRKAEKAGRVQSYTHVYILTCSRAAKG